MAFLFFGRGTSLEISDSGAPLHFGQILKELQSVHNAKLKLIPKSPWATCSILDTWIEGYNIVKLLLHFPSILQDAESGSSFFLYSIAVSVVSKFRIVAGEIQKKGVQLASAI